MRSVQERMDKTRVAIVGMGMIGRAHWEALRRMPEVEIVAVCGSCEQEAHELAARFDIPQWYASYQEMISTSGADAIHNCTPNALHDAVNRAAIAAGKHIYAEKPMSSTAADARAVWHAAEAAGVVHGINHQYRMNAAVQEMRVRIQRGDMGRPFLVSGRYHQQSGLYATDYNWRMTEGGLSCGLSDIGTHWVDTARCVLGRELTRVFASMQTVHPVRTKPDGTQVQVETDDLSCVLVQFEGGVQGVVTVSKVSAGHQNDLVLGVDGQHFSLLWAQEEPMRLHIGHKTEPNATLQMAPALADPTVADLVTLPGGHPLGFYDALLAAVREFYAVVRGEKAQSAMRCATFADGFAGMAFVEAAVKSASLGQWVDIETP